MNEKMREYICTCPHCKGKMNDFFCGNFKGAYYNKHLKTLRSKYFCTEECYKDYKKNFIVEVYNSKPIFCVEIDGEKRYMPYFEATYYFTNINDCKKKMDMEGITVTKLSMFGL